MKKIALVLFLLIANSAYGQSTYFTISVAFPQVAFGGDESGDNYVTILQALNNNSVPITGHLELFSDSGAALAVLLEGQGPQSTWDISLAAGEARQIQLTLNGPVTAGWMVITYSPSDALTTVVLQYRNAGALRSEVGVEPAFPDFDIPLSADVAVETDDGGNGSLINVGVALVNPDTATDSFLIRLWDPSTGAVLASVPISLPANGHVAKFLGELFPNVLSIGRLRAKLSIDSCATSACTSIGGNGFLATALRLNGSQFTTVPVAERQDTGDPVRILPQVAFGGPTAGLNMKTVLYFTTNVSTGVFGTIDIFDDAGNPLPASADGAAAAASIPFTVPGNRVSRVVLSGDQTLRSGWIRLTLSGSVHLIASAIFQTFNGANLTSEASVLESPAATQALLYAKSQAGLSNVGVAFANPQTTSNVVTLKIFNRSGSLLASKDITLSPKGHLARFITEIFPDVAADPNFDGSLSMASATAFSAVALRLTFDKIATIPVAFDGLYRPTITTIRVTRTQRSPSVQIDFSIDVTDVDGNVATSSSTTVTGAALLFFTSSGQNSVYDVSLDGSPLISRTTGTITGSVKPTDITTVPSGTQAILLVQIFDAAGLASNLIYVPFRF
jgi:hypothetical protein